MSMYRCMADSLWEVRCYYKSIHKLHDDIGDFYNKAFLIITGVISSRFRSIKHIDALSFICIHLHPQSPIPTVNPKCPLSALA